MLNWCCYIMFAGRCRVESGTFKGLACMETPTYIEQKISFVTLYYWIFHCFNELNFFIKIFGLKTFLYYCKKFAEEFLKNFFRITNYNRYKKIKSFRHQWINTKNYINLISKFLLKSLRLNLVVFYVYLKNTYNYI